MVKLIVAVPTMIARRLLIARHSPPRRTPKRTVPAPPRMRQHRRVATPREWRYSLAVLGLVTGSALLAATLDSTAPVPAVSLSLDTVHPQAYSQLKALLGDRCSIDTDDRDSHGRDANSYHTDRSPYAITYPLTTEEVSTIATICHQHRIAMIPFGSGTSLEGHTSAPVGGVVIDLSRMNRVLAINADDMDCVVEPGISWNELNETLRQHRLFFPVDPGPGASIAGMIATSASGTNAVRYGTMRHNVINLTVVLSDGTVIRTGQRARKSSAGYNLTQLFIGSEGTLGIVTEATLKLANIPAHTAVGVSHFATVTEAANVAMDIQRAGIQVGCVELLDEVCVRMVNQYTGLLLTELPTLFFKFTGSSEAVVNDTVSGVSAIIGKHRGSELVWASDPMMRDRLWDGRKQALWATMAYQPTNKFMTTDVCLPLSKFAANVESAKELIRASGLVAPIVGHAGDGNFHVLISIDPDNASEMTAANQLNRTMVERAIRDHGTISGEHGIGVGKIDYLPMELGDSSIAVMRSIKRALDPHQLMNPGKVFRSLASAPASATD